MNDVISSCDTDCSIVVPLRRWVYKTQAEIFGEKKLEWRVSVFFQVGFVCLLKQQKRILKCPKTVVFVGETAGFWGVTTPTF